MKVQRKRQTRQDFFQVLESQKNAFAPWAYVGYPEIVQRLFPGVDLDALRRDDEEYFQKNATTPIIRDDMYKDAEIAVNYGRNVRQLCEESGYTLKGVADQIGITLQRLHQIVNGERKRIDRNILLLLCGIFQKSPIELMGLGSTEYITTLNFVPDELVKKASFITSRLFVDGKPLLKQLVQLASLDSHRRAMLTRFLQSTPIIRILSPEEIKEAVSGYCHELSINDILSDPALKLNDCKGALIRLNSLDKQLLDIFLSVAALPPEKWSGVSTILSEAGFASV